MKKRFLSLILSAVLAGTFMVGCSQGANSPVTAVNQMMDSVCYLKDSDGAYDNIGMTSQQIRDIFTETAEQVLQSQFFPEEEAVEEDLTEETVVEEEVTEEEATTEDATTEDASEEATEGEEEAKAVEIRPEVKEMAQKQLSAMQEVVKYETKLLTQSSTDAQVKLIVYPVDIGAYYTDYINITNNMPLEPENPTEEEKAEIDQQWKQAYLDSLDNLKTSKESLEMTVQLYKSDGKWIIDGMSSIISDLFHVITGSY